MLLNAAKCCGALKHQTNDLRYKKSEKHFPPQMYTDFAFISGGFVNNCKIFHTISSVCLLSLIYLGL